MTEGIANIVFDMGGVLVGFDRARCIGGFERIGADAAAKYVKDGRVEGLFLRSETGETTEEGFYEEARALCGITAASGEIAAAWNSLLTPMSAEKAVRLAELAGTRRVFLLSNTNPTHWRHCRENLLKAAGYGVDDYFERVFLSYEMGLRKPSPDIFISMMEAGGMVPGETLFVDDSLDNCEAAASLGMKTFHNCGLDDWLAHIR